MEIEEENDDLESFHIVVKKTITAYVDIRAKNMEDAIDMYNIGIEVREDGPPAARDDMKGYVDDYGVDDVEEEILYDECYKNR